MDTELQEKSFNEQYNVLINNICKDLNDDDKKLIFKAIDIYINNSKSPNWGESEEPSILHLLEICSILHLEIGVSVYSMLATILYIPYSTTNLITLKFIEEGFGSNVANITKYFYEIKELKLKNETYETEAVRNLLLKKSIDIRAFLIYMSWHLHEVRTFKAFSDLKRMEIAWKCMLFIPICHRIGLFKFKAEFEEYYMSTIHPQAYISIKNQISTTEKEQQTAIADFIKPIEEKLKKEGYECDIKSRVKSVPSIWSKMKRMGFKNISEIYDLFAIRIVLMNSISDEISDCWKVYSIVEELYDPFPDRLRDWITNPKKSGYEALHMTVKTKTGLIVEVQIRTKRMNENAELGSAAHWKYKESNYTRTSDKWLNDIKEIMENHDDRYSKMDMFPNDIFIITPTGDVRQLPKNSTVLDFAFSIHTSIGLTCTSARVNNKIVPIRYVLENGDRVEIFTSKKQQPSSDWLNFVVTGRAANRIKVALDQEKTLQAKAGHEILDRKFRNWKMKLTTERINMLMKFYKIKFEKDFFASIYNDKIDPLEIKKLIKETEEQENPDLQIHNNEHDEKSHTDKYIKTDIIFIDSDSDNLNYNLAKCCNPILGDKVFGFVTVDRGITIHRYSCPNAAELISKYKYRIIDAEWSGKGTESPFPANLYLAGEERKGILDDINSLLKDEMKINIESTSFNTQNNKFSASYKIYVRDAKHIDFLIHKLEQIKGISSVRREVLR